MEPMHKQGFRAPGAVLRAAALGVVLVALATIVACGDDESSGVSATATPSAPTRAASPAATVTAASSPAGGAQASPRATTVASATTTAPSATAGAQTLTEVATDNQFSQTALTAKAGTSIALTLTNKGSAIHNWHLLDAKDANGRDITTKLISPGQSETVVFTIAAPGTYHFQCDVHPQDMKGTLTIS